MRDGARFAEVQSELIDFYFKHNPTPKIRIKPIADANGELIRETGEIIIDIDLWKNYPNLREGVFLEELHHFRQLVDRGWWRDGRLIRKLTQADLDWMEDDVVKRLLDSGLEETL